MVDSLCTPRPAAMHTKGTLRANHQRM
jgi:hypothetical protein